MKSISIQIIIFFLCEAYCQTDCGHSSWIPYKDEKCFKYLPNELPVTREDAEAVCSREITDSDELSAAYMPTLAEIRSLEEQELVEDYIFGNFTLYDNVWIRAKRGSDKFFWNDETPMEYTNWESNSPSTNPLKDCVVMTSGLVRNYNSSENNDSDNVYDIMAGAGFWKDVSCNSKSMTACQKYQVWSVDKIQSTLLQMKTKLESELSKLKFIIEALSRI